LNNELHNTLSLFTWRKRNHDLGVVQTDDNAEGRPTAPEGAENRGQLLSRPRGDNALPLRHTSYLELPLVRVGQTPRASRDGT
jgi:hypothetical protein